MARRVLVIDDDAQIRAVAAASLSLVAKWEVLSAGSGEEGVAMAASKQPDAILLDVVMPEMDGWATLEALQLDPTNARIPVIMLTADAGVGAASARDRRVAAVIAKPFDIMGLPGLVASALGWDL